MPQTRFVQQKSLGLKILVCINKIDRHDARPDEVVDEVFDLMVNLGASDEQLDFPYVYAAARDGYAISELDDPKRTSSSSSSSITCPSRRRSRCTAQFQVATLDYSPYLGRVVIGRVFNGRIKRGMSAVACRADGGRDAFGSRAS